MSHIARGRSQASFSPPGHAFGFGVTGGAVAGKVAIGVDVAWVVAVVVLGSMYAVELGAGALVDATNEASVGLTVRSDESSFLCMRAKTSPPTTRAVAAMTPAIIAAVRLRVVPCGT